MSSSAGDQLNIALKSFELKLPGAVQSLQSGAPADDTGQFLIQAAAQADPQLAAYLKGGKQVANTLGQIFGQGSGVAETLNKLLSGDILGAIGRIFNGRTYQSDQYYGALYYYYYVVGGYGDSQPGTVAGAEGAALIRLQPNQNRVTDEMVAPALIWLESKTGVYISGRQHLEALQESPDKYMALYAVNKNTTIDRVRVTLASQMVQEFMPDRGYGGNVGSWAHAQGVYDNLISAAVFNARINDPASITDSTASVTTGLVYGLLLDPLSFWRAATDSVKAVTVLLAAVILCLVYWLFSSGSGKLAKK